VHRILKPKLLFTVWAVITFVFLFLPIFVMVVFAFNRPSLASMPNFDGSNMSALSPAQIGDVTLWNGFTHGWFSVALHSPLYLPAIIKSAEIALLTATIATAIGLCAALALARMKRRRRAPFDALVYLTLVVPEIVLAVGLLVFFVQAGVYVPGFPELGAGTILLGQVIFDASLAMLIIRARFVGMGDSLEEASYDLGARPLSTFRQVTLPRLMPAVVAAFLLSFTFSFDDYVVPAFTNGTTNTWPIVLYSAVRFGITPSVNAMATMMFAVNVLLIVITALILRRSRVRVGPGQEKAKGLGGAMGLG